MTFLQQTAQQIFDTHGPRLRDVWVILPTRRAVSVFLDELAQLSDRPFLAPHALAVDDFITGAAGLQLIDSVSLLFELYEVFRDIDPAVEFEQFVGWASVLLADFDRIDQYLVNPGELFSYLTAAKALERWQKEMPETATPIVETPGTTRYFKLFENLNVAYHALHRRLAAQGLAYRGMAYRQLADNVESLIRDNLAYERVYFVGFNALSRAEEQIIGVLVEAQKAELIWDADPYYLDDENQEAGEFLRRYRKNGWFSPSQNRPGLPANHPVQLPENLIGTEKNIRVVGVPNASMQAKVAGQLYKESKNSRSGRTCIVLADETLLVPVLYALDEGVTDLNVTMGLSLRSSLLFTLVDTLFEMQRTVHEFRTKDGRDLRIPKFHHRHIVKVLNHPFVKQYERIHNLQWPGDVLESGEVLPPEPLFGWIAKEIVKNQRVYLTEADIGELGQDDALVRALFTRWSDDQPTRVIQTFYDLIELLRTVYRHSQDAIEIEYLYLFFSLLKQLETTLERGAWGMGGQTSADDAPREELILPHAPAVTVRSFRQFLYELIRQTSIPFTSEGRSPLQIMGMLETRALDFERVIILSVNEGILPQSRRLNSLIPFDIARDPSINLPTYREQEAVMAYHFYRLLQRANDIVLLHTTSTDAYGNSKGEPSRFIRQIEHELVPKANRRAAAEQEVLLKKGNFAEADAIRLPRIQLSKPTVRFGQPGTEALPELVALRVPKTEAIRAELIRTLEGKGLYPSYLNQFVSCSMRFYFSRIVGVSEEEEVEEKMGAAEFGSWLHAVMERLDLDYRMQDRPVDEAIIRKVLEEEFAKSNKGRVIESGMNLLLYEMAQKLMLDFQRQQNALPGLTVIGSEQTLETYIDVPLGGRQLRVRIAGKVDRIERFNGQIRIVDYKTGKVSLAEKPSDDLTEKLLHDGQSDKMRQVWLYRYLALKNIREHGGLPRDKAKQSIFPTEGLPVEAGFYSFRDVPGGFKSNPVRFGPDDSPAQYIEDSEELLRKLIGRMLDPDEPFQKTDRLETCQYCDYKRICGR